MALKKQVVISQIEIQPDGTLGIRLDKQVVDGDAIVAHDYHRTVVPPDVAVDDQMAAVTVNLVQMGWPAPEAAGIERIRKIAAVEHTPAVRAAYKKASKDAETLPEMT